MQCLADTACIIIFLICSCFFIYIFKYLFLNTLLPMWANRRSVFQGAKVCIKNELFKKKGFGGGEI